MSVLLNSGTEIYPILAFVAMVMKIWDSTSNNKWSMAKGLDRHRVRQNIAYLVSLVMNKFLSSH